MHYDLYVFGLAIKQATTAFAELSQALSFADNEYIEHMNTADALVGAGLVRILLNKN